MRFIQREVFAGDAGEQRGFEVTESALKVRAWGKISAIEIREVQS